MNSSQSYLIILSSHTKNFVLTHKVLCTGNKRSNGTAIIIKQTVIRRHDDDSPTLMWNDSTDTIGSQGIRTLQWKESISDQYPHTTIGTYIEDTVHHIGTVDLGIHFNSGIFSIQIFHYTVIALYIKDIIRLMDSPHIAKHTNRVVKRIGHAVVNQFAVFCRFVIAKFINTTGIDSFLNSGCQYGTHIREVI